MGNIIPFNYKFYNVKFLKNIFKKKKEYKKIILVMNLNVTTIKLNKINHKYYVKYFSLKYPKYLFITFNKIKIDKSNIVSINDIYVKNNILLPINYAIHFSYLSTLCNKVICLETGPGIFCFNKENKNRKNNIFFIDTLCQPSPRCLSVDKYMCISKYELYFLHYYHKNNHELIMELKKFLKK